jgi:methyl-accepting chemotaxis protein
MLARHRLIRRPPGRPLAPVAIRTARRGTITRDRGRMAQPNRRRTYLINPRFQWRFIGFMAAVSLLAISMLFVSNIVFFRTMEQEALSVGLTRDNPYFDFLDEQKSALSKVYFAVSALVFVVMVSLGIFYSHRIVGPLHNLNNKMKRIASGDDLSPVSFRRKDQFQELAESFNAMIEKFRNRS